MTDANLSNTAKDALYASETSEGLIALLTIIPDQGDTARLSDDQVDTTHDGQIYEAVPFILTLPDSTEDRPPVGRIEISNVSRKLMEAIRAPASTAPVAEIRVVLLSDPESLEIGPLEFEIRDVRWDSGTVTADLVVEPILKRAVPHLRFTPGQFPGLFR